MKCVIAVLATLILGAGGAVADPAQEDASTNAQVRAAAPRVAPTPLVAELLKIVEGERESIAALRREIAVTREPAAVLELQRHIETLKRDTEIALMRTQVTYARREGRIEVATRLERVLDILIAPQRAATPSRSAAPAAAR